MRHSELEQMYNVEETHWWFSGKRILFERLLRRRLAKPDLKILDVGSGTGAVPAEFARFGWICASDRDIGALRLADSRGVRCVCCCDIERLSIADESIDLVFAFDILEHVEDDAGALAEIARVLKPGGAVAIHVPAWPSLWSSHDEALEHKRRYTRRALRRLIDESPLEIERLTWASAAILAPAFVIRSVRRLLPRRPGGNPPSEVFALPGPFNTAMRALYRLEAAVGSGVGLPFGTSLAAIAAKSPTATPAARIQSRS